MGNIMSRVLICPGEARCLFCIRDERGQREHQRIRKRESDTQEMRNALLFSIDRDTCAHVLEFNKGHKTQIWGRQKEMKERPVNDRVKCWAPRTDTITSILLLQVLGCDFYLACRWSHYNCKDYHRLDAPLYIYHCLSWYFLCHWSYLKRWYLFGLVLGAVGEGVGHWTCPNKPLPYSRTDFPMLNMYEIPCLVMMLGWQNILLWYTATYKKFCYCTC